MNNLKLNNITIFFRPEESEDSKDTRGIFVEIVWTPMTPSKGAPTI